MCVCVNHSVVSDSPRPHGLQPASLLRPWDSPGKSTGVGCHFLFRVTICQTLSKHVQAIGQAPQGKPNASFNFTLVPLNISAPAFKPSGALGLEHGRWLLTQSTTSPPCRQPSLAASDPGHRHHSPGPSSRPCRCCEAGAGFP